MGETEPDGGEIRRDSHKVDLAEKLLGDRPHRHECGVTVEEAPLGRGEPDLDQGQGYQVAVGLSQLLGGPAGKEDRTEESCGLVLGDALPSLPLDLEVHEAGRGAVGDHGGGLEKFRGQLFKGGMPQDEKETSLLLSRTNRIDPQGAHRRPLLRCGKLGKDAMRGKGQDLPFFVGAGKGKVPTGDPSGRGKDSPLGLQDKAPLLSNVEPRRIRPQKRGGQGEDGGGNAVDFVALQGTEDIEHVADGIGVEKDTLLKLPLGPGQNVELELRGIGRILRLEELLVEGRIFPPLRIPELSHHHPRKQEGRRPEEGELSRGHGVEVVLPQKHQIVTPGGLERGEKTGNKAVPPRHQENDGQEGMKDRKGQ